MSEVATIIADLVRAGVDPELVGRTAAALAQNVQIVQSVKDPVADKRRAYDRERKATKKRSTGIPPESAETTGNALPPEGSSPTPPSPNPPSIPPSPPKGGSSPVERAISVFVQEAQRANLPVPHKVTADRRRKIEARLKEHGESVWAEACRKMADSAFCRGENERGWRADLDFLCQPKSFNGLLEGKYDDRQSRAPPSRESFIDAQQALEREGYFTDGQDGIASHNGHADGLPTELGDGQAGTVVDLRPGAARRLGFGHR